MSEAVRQALVDNPKLSSKGYASVAATHRSDLLSADRTDTYLIEMLTWLLKNCDEPIMLTAVRSDHPKLDQPWLHSGGKAVDMYPKNWEEREQEAVCNVLKALSENPYCENVGLGGVVRKWRTYVTWPTTPYFWLFDDDIQDHIHAGSACARDETGGARAAAP
jgi:hypothetical protein